MNNTAEPKLLMVSSGFGSQKTTTNELPKMSFLTSQKWLMLQTWKTGLNIIISLAHEKLSLSHKAKHSYYDKYCYRRSCGRAEPLSDHVAEKNGRGSYGRRGNHKYTVWVLCPPVIWPLVAATIWQAKSDIRFYVWTLKWHIKELKQILLYENQFGNV